MKPTIRLILFVLISLILMNCNQNQKKYIEPINPNATEKARNLYYFLQDIQGKYTLSGMHNFCGKGAEYTYQLEELTKLIPIVWGSDFSFCVEGDNSMNYQHCGPANLPPIDQKRWGIQRDTTKDLNPVKLEFLNISLADARESTISEAKRMYAQGHIITMMWHGCYPTEGDCCDGSSIWAMENRPTPEEWDELVTEGTELNNKWKEGADKIAGYLKEFQDADIPVLWRPYHEMNGVWFWWCNQQGEQGFKRLWIMMYDYFTNHHKLNNLIWVWNTNAPRDIPGDEAWPYELFYPGTEYVDVLAADVYRNDYKQSHHDQLVELGGGKPIALGEVGNLPSLDVLEQQPQWTWFMPWGWILFTFSQPDEIKKIMSAEQVLTLNEIERDKNGKYSVKN
ncbi:MAG: hypothetical protein JW833_09130 [Prolixibacteraceae bacterium]|nr:hypothetical protein [Prolixibacteraceae bacterium]